MSIPLGISASEIASLKDGSLDHNKSEVLCRMARYAYLTRENEIRSALGSNWSGVETWLDESINNQGYAAWAEGVAVVSFRGTDSPSDWQKNADAFFPDPHPLGGRRHDGFFDVWAQKSSAVRDILSTKIPAGSQLWLSGHSLGGVLATAAAADFLVSRPGRVKESMSVITFGQPRYGNEEFGRKYDAKMLRTHWFYANEKDPVPHLGPNVLGYRHGGTLKYFNDRGQLIPLTKEQAGLQAVGSTPEAQAARKWQQVEEVANNKDTRPELEAFVREIELDVGGFLVTAPPAGNLQGDFAWSGEAHSLELYWQRIKALT